MSAMIWAAYERVSTEEQAEEGHSIQVQKEGITTEPRSGSSLRK